MTTNQKLVAISLKMRQAWISLTLQIMFIQQTHTHQQMCWVYSREFECLFSIPYIELHDQYSTSVLLISGHLSLHLPENTSLSLSLHFCPRPWRDHWQQKRLCAESNDIRRAAGSDKQLVRLMTYSSHATENKSKSNRRRIKLLSWEICSNTFQPMHFHDCLVWLLEKIIAITDFSSPLEQKRKTKTLQWMWENIYKKNLSWKY